MVDNATNAPYTVITYEMGTSMSSFTLFTSEGRLNL